jgi:phosphopantothenoylcysteine decarboxylase/phosphopantothenate--cysteine ligase
MRILVTAGPTREYLDDVRFISNPSSGRMGFAVAEAAVLAGHEVTLVAGPVNRTAPRGVARIDVTSTEEMRRAVREHFDASDAVVMAAAPSDYRPAERRPGKIKKGAEELALRLVRNPDILAELGREKKRKILIGFALESPVDRGEALRKLREKNLDAIVLNSPQAFGAEKNSVEIITAAGESVVLSDADKREIGKRLVKLVESLASARHHREPKRPCKK